MNNGQIMNLLYIALGLIVFIIICLIAFLVFTKLKEKNEKEVEFGTNNKKGNNQSPVSNKQSVFNFMEFDKIEDGMIIQKNGNRFLMAINCQGVNYDLMSDVEKTGVEAGFVQFLNTLRYPIQLYIQTKTVNLEESVIKYKNRLRGFEDKLAKMKFQYEQMLKSEQYSTEELNRVYYEITKQSNLVEYGRDIIYNTERMSLNKNVLNKQYYIIVSYYASEAANGDFDKEEIKNLAFSELYTKCQSLVRALSVCGVNGKVLNSNELVELLYVAYNRDDYEIYDAKKAIDSGFEDLYSTAPDVLDKRMKALDKEIEKQALELAQEKVAEARTEKELKLMQKEEDIDELIDKMAKIILNENVEYIGRDIVEVAEKNIDKKSESRRNRVSKEVEEKNVKKERKQRKTSRSEETK